PRTHRSIPADAADVARDASPVDRNCAPASFVLDRKMRTTVWVTVMLLVAIGVTSAIARAVFTGDLSHRVESIRGRLFDAPPYAEKDLAEVDNKFGNLRLTTLLHVVPGGIFLLLAPIQF